MKERERFRKDLEIFIKQRNDCSVKITSLAVSHRVSPTERTTQSVSALYVIARGRFCINAA